MPHRNRSKSCFFAGGLSPSKQWVTAPPASKTLDQSAAESRPNLGLQSSPARLRGSFEGFASFVSYCDSSSSYGSARDPLACRRLHFHRGARPNTFVLSADSNGADRSMMSAGTSSRKPLLRPNFEQITEFWSFCACSMEIGRAHV